MWNDTDIPLAFLITFRSYGTWLHGDIRGAVDRNNNGYGSPRLEHLPVRKEYVRSVMKRAPVLLDAAQRRSVENAIRETCDKRDWFLQAVNVRTNHAHSVVSIGVKKPEIALNAFKANATRQMKEDGCWDMPDTPWAEKGAAVIFGMKGMLQTRSNTFCTDKGTSCRSSTRLETLQHVVLKESGRYGSRF